MKRVYRLYLETSFWNRLGDTATWTARRATYRFLNRACRGHDILISPLVVQEVDETPDPQERKVIERRMRDARPIVVSGESKCLAIATALREIGCYGPRMLADLSHVGYAVMGQADGLATWDRRTLARQGVRNAVAAHCRREGLLAPLIGTPEELTEWLDLKT